MRCGIPNAFILYITMYKMHVTLCSYCAIRILIYKTFPVHMKEVTRMCLRCVVIERWILLYILLLIIIYIYISVKKLKTLKIYAVMLRLVSDVFLNIIKFCCVWLTHHCIFLCVNLLTRVPKDPLLQYNPSDLKFVYAVQ